MVDSDHLADFPLTVSRVPAVGEPHPDPLGEQHFQTGVVVLGGGDLVHQCAEFGHALLERIHLPGLLVQLLVEALDGG